MEDEIEISLWFDPSASLKNEGEQGDNSGDSSYPLFDLNDTISVLYKLNGCIGEIQSLTNELFPIGEIFNERLRSNETTWEEKRGQLSQLRFVALSKVKEIIETLQNPQIKQYCLQKKQKGFMKQKYRKIVKMFLTNGEYKKFQQIISESTVRETDYLIYLDKEKNTRRLNRKEKKEESLEYASELFNSEVCFEVISNSTNGDNSKNQTFVATNFDDLSALTDQDIADQDMDDILEFQQDMNDLEDSFVELEGKLAPVTDILVNIRDVHLASAEKNTERSVEIMIDSNKKQGSNVKFICFLVFSLFLYVTFFSFTKNSN